MCKDRLERYGLVAACIRRNYLILLSFRKWNVYEYVKLEFQGPTGPLTGKQKLGIRGIQDSRQFAFG